MKISPKNIMLEQLDATLAQYAPLKTLNPPRKGWIRAIRDALGMSGRQLGERIGVSKMRVADLEQAESEGATTINSLRRAAEALDCVLVYALVPRATLEDTLRDQAEKKAAHLIQRASHTMALEDQSISDKERKRMLNDKAEYLIESRPRTLWDKD